jgi:hypothetical protein
MQEIWRDIVGYEGYYQISNMGAVRSLNRTVLGKNNNPLNVYGVRLSPTNNGNGY